MSDRQQLILLGSSTGGTEALKTVLTALPKQIPGICIVQHIPPVFSASFAERLDSLCPFTVKEAEDGDRVEAGRALLAPGNYHMSLVEEHNQLRVALTQEPSVWHQRPAVDVLFKSAAQLRLKQSVSALLTGMGRDGADGLLELRKAGWRTLNQDEASCAVYGMPKAAWENGGSEKQLPLEAIAQALMDALADG